MADAAVREDKYGTRWILRLSDSAGGIWTWRAYREGDDERGQGHGHIHLHFHEAQRMATIVDVQVDGGMRGRGIGSMLVQHAIAKCRRWKYNKIKGEITDFANWCGLRDFYEKLGFSFRQSEPGDTRRAGTIRKVIQ